MKKNRRNERPDWEDYELQILDKYESEYPKCIVIGNQKIKGKFSKKNRQIDVLISIETKYAKDGLMHDKFGIVECKHLSRKIDLQKFESFVSKKKDVGAAFGIMISTKGFSRGLENYARREKITLEKVEYENLKNYYYTTPNQIPEVFLQAINYSCLYCTHCDKSILFELVTVYGMAEHEDIHCPKCKVALSNQRSDGGHRVIKIFSGKNISEEEIEALILKHILSTQREWDREYGVPRKNISEILCFICRKELEDGFFPSKKEVYDNHNICFECFSGKRVVLIDSKIPTFF